MGRERLLYQGCRIPDPILVAQLEQFALEAESVQDHIREARRRVHDQVPTNAHLLIIDLSGRDFEDRDFRNPRLRHEILELQYGCPEPICGESFRHMCGFEPGDHRVEIWHVKSDPDRIYRLPDTWIATGGDAMPSELVYGGPNADWLKKAVQAMQTLTALKVPGVAICLGHQLFNFSCGGRVGQFRPEREIGTVSLSASSTWQPRLLHDFWDDHGTMQIAAVHSESVYERPAVRGAAHIATNRYCPYQGGAFKLDPDIPLREADATDQITVTIQNHPELLARYLQLLRDIWYEPCMTEGVDLDTMVFGNTPRARTLWLQVVEMLGRRAIKRGA
jgi:GMP synthase-like glutamine amidotransferase